MKLGRPKSLNKNDIAATCCYLYWEKGIHNVSYNEIIKYSKVSKGSIYKLFKNEDELKKQTLAYYMNNHVSELREILTETDDIFYFLGKWKHIVSQKSYMPCYFSITNLMKSSLSNETINYLKKIERKYKKMFLDIVKRHVKLYELEVDKGKMAELSLFLYHNFTLINNLINNSTSKRDIAIMQSSIFEKVRSCLK